MKNVVPVTEITLEIDDEVTPSARVTRSSFHRWVDALMVLLMAPSMFVGFGFWKDWFSSVDQVICSFCLLIGAIAALVRSTWQGELTGFRYAFAGLLCCLAGIVIFASYSLGIPSLSGVACALILAAWCSIRILGESYPHCLAIGLVFVIPTAVDGLADSGAFSWLESSAISITSGLADAAELSHVREAKTLIFGLGVADQFSCLGNWDSVVSLFGVAVFCILTFRRNLLPGLLTITTSVLVWIATRGVGWVWLAWMGVKNGEWYGWSFGLEIGLFLLGAVLVVSIDQFFSALFEPIPFEFINTDFPLFAFAWNWLCGLPTLTVFVPQRDDAFTDLEEDFSPLERET